MKQEIVRICHFCQKKIVLLVDFEDMQKWKDGMLIQNAMPYLTNDERELLMSGTCGICFDKMFKED